MKARRGSKWWWMLPEPGRGRGEVSESGSSAWHVPWETEHRVDMATSWQMPGEVFGLSLASWIHPLNSLPQSLSKPLSLLTTAPSFLLLEALTSWHVHLMVTTLQGLVTGQIWPRALLPPLLSMLYKKTIKPTRNQRCPHLQMWAMHGHL